MLAGQGVAVAEQRVAVGVGERIAISLGERGVLDRAGGAAAVPGALRAGVLRMRLARLAVHALLPVHALLAALAVAGGPGEVVLAAVGRVVRLVGRLDGTPVGGLVERRGGRRVMATVRLGPAPGGGLVETVVGGVGVQPVGLVESGLDLAAVLVDGFALGLGLRAAALGRDLLLLGLLRLPLGVQAGAVGVQLGLPGLQVALLDHLVLLLGLLAELCGALAVGLLLPRSRALRGVHAHDDEDDEDDERQQDDPDDDGCGQFHGRLLAVDSSARGARRSSCGYG